jgi:hypothetical protein
MFVFVLGCLFLLAPPRVERKEVRYQVQCLNGKEVLIKYMTEQRMTTMY